MPPPAHLTNNHHSSSLSSNRSRSRSPHPSLQHHHHHHSSSSLTNKNSSSSSPPLLHSSSRKRFSPNIKSNPSDTSKALSAHPLPIVPLPPTLGAFDPLTLSIIERQRLTAAYASLFAGVPQANNYFPGNIDPAAFRNNGSSSLFHNLDSSAMTAALMQREHFLNSLRQQHEHLEHERAALTALSKVSKPPPPPPPPSSSSATVNLPKTERISPKNSTEDAPRISPKVSTSPGSHSSTSSSSSKKVKHVKREHQSPSPSAPPTNESTEIKLKEESNVEATPPMTTTTEV